MASGLNALKTRQLAGFAGREMRFQTRRRAEKTPISPIAASIIAPVWGKKLPETIEQAQKRFAYPAPLRLMFQDEARFGRISQTRYCWCPKPMRPLTQAMVTQEYTYAYAAGSPLEGQKCRWAGLSLAD